MGDPKLYRSQIGTVEQNRKIQECPVSQSADFARVFVTPNKFRRNEAKREAAPTSSYDLDYDLCSEAEDRPKDNSGFDVPTSRRSRQKAKAKARAQSVQSEADIRQRWRSAASVETHKSKCGRRRAAKRQGDASDDDLPFGQGKPKSKTHRAKSEVVDSDESPPPVRRQEGRNTLESRFSKLDKLVQGLFHGFQKQLSN